MEKSAITKFIIIISFFPGSLLGQEWSLKLKSKVELRSWKLTSKAIKNEQFLNGATVKLCKGPSVVSQTTSDPEGNFEMSIPVNGNYTLEITYPGCNPKKFAVNSSGVPSNAVAANLKPSLDITGFIMSKLIKGVNYIGLNQSLVTVEYKPGSNGFEKKEEALESKIYDAEYKVIQKFCTANKLGDMALDRKDYSLAKTFYLMAMNIMDGEPYPKGQLKRAEEGLKEEKAANRARSSVKTGKKVKAKANTTAPQQKITSKPTKSTDLKKSGETGKPARKIPKKL
jgi:hypothetical protein